MSKKWNDPDARDNYALLITLDNIIISFIFSSNVFTFIMPSSFSLSIALQPIFYQGSF